MRKRSGIEAEDPVNVSKTGRGVDSGGAISSDLVKVSINVAKCQRWFCGVYPVSAASACEGAGSLSALGESLKPVRNNA